MKFEPVVREDLTCQNASSFKFSIINYILDKGHEKTTSNFLVTLNENLSYIINTTQHSYINYTNIISECFTICTKYILAYIYD